MSLLSLLWSNACPLADGLIFYTVITIPAPIIGAALGALSYSISRKIGIIIFILILLMIAAIPVVEIYFNPQIYFYNPLIGFFPGTIYDEAIEVDLKLIVYRILNLLFFSFLFYLIFKALISNSIYLLKAAWIYFIIVPTAFILSSSELGYSTTANRVFKDLDRTICTDNFEIHYSSKMSDTLINVIALHHEFYFSELEKFFQFKPSKKISSLIYLDGAQKKNLFGTENADVAKPWIPEIYITAENYDRTLKHEIAHCFTAEFGGAVFKLADSFNPSLIEGVAMAADPVYNSHDLDFMAALAFSNKFEVNIEELFNSFNFFKQPSSLGYITSGSFIKFLIDKDGIDNFKKLYTDMDFTKYYSKDLSLLIKEYKSYLQNKFAFGKASSHKANYYFGRKAIFYKDCPRYITKKINKGWKLLEENKLEAAKKQFQDALNSGKNYSAVLGLAYCYSQLSQFNQAIELLENYLPSFENSAYWYQLKFYLADTFVRTNTISEAKSIYSSIVDMNPNRTLYSLAKLRLDLISMDSLIMKYLDGKNDEKLRILKSLNNEKFNYNSLPTFISLSKLESLDYTDFLANFDKVLVVSDYESCYALFKLSQFMCEKMDFDRARKMAALSVRFYDNSFNSILENNFVKMTWMYKNSKDILLKFVYD